VLVAVVLWLLAYLVKRDGVLLRPVVLMFAVGFVAMAVVSWQFFFIAPVIVELLIAACLVVAAVGLKKETVAKNSLVER
jgi:Gpi18-like mannosyltransferase